MSRDEARLREAIAQHRAGYYDVADAAYREHLKQAPDDPSGLHFLGLLRTHQGRTDEAIALLKAALARDPEYVDAWSNLGIAYFHKQDLERAAACCHRAIDLAPGFANAWANLGMALRAGHALEEALSAWARALELQPGMRNVAIAYGHLLYRLDRGAQALEFYRRWQATSPDDPIPQHMLAALGGAAQPARASDGYVRAVFDDFADSFDLSLEHLKYEAPKLLVEVVLHSGLASAGRKLKVLDVGCGTGLCGPLLRPFAARLVGVDLSPKMLSKAAARGVYDQLNCAELTGWLAECVQRFDVVIAADVLCYFGDLSTAFHRVRDVLMPGGRFACSLESLRHEGSPRAYELLPHGRYQHDRAYVEAMLAEARLHPTSLTEGVLRFERGDAVAGHLVVATREGATGE